MPTMFQESTQYQEKDCLHAEISGCHHIWFPLPWAERTRQAKALMSVPEPILGISDVIYAWVGVRETRCAQQTRPRQDFPLCLCQTYQQVLRESPKSTSGHTSIFLQGAFTSCLYPWPCLWGRDWFLDMCLPRVSTQLPHFLNRENGKANGKRHPMGNRKESEVYRCIKHKASSLPVLSSSFYHWDYRHRFFICYLQTDKQLFQL